MNSGLFRHRITIQKHEADANENGFRSPEEQKYLNVKSAWAMIKTLSDKGSAYEFYEAATTHAQNTNSFVIRYTPGITADMRIKYNGRTFEILSVINDGELNKTLTIVGRELI
ncbi:head-tail adaptor protein [Peribacillus loiseleuriae]|uniref:Head-tail adaptor protein n=2 Tax=Peribacillus loiseleuriae TaxID=1679170 RepID=A0A0K9H089_9BACI|nr:head-tail adaptor protein [Peribacillus loiseleuriae]